MAATVNLKSGLFRADVYGQNAVESIADRPLFQLDLIDSFATQAIQQIASCEKQIVSMLAATAPQINPLEQEVGNIQDELAGLPGVEQKLKEFAGPAGGVTAEVNEAHRLKGLRDRESHCLSSVARGGVLVVVGGTTGFDVPLNHASSQKTSPRGETYSVFLPTVEEPIRFCFDQDRMASIHAQSKYSGGRDLNPQIVLEIPRFPTERPS